MASCKLPRRRRFNSLLLPLTAATVFGWTIAGAAAADAAAIAYFFNVYDKHLIFWFFFFFTKKFVITINTQLFNRGEPVSIWGHV